MIQVQQGARGSVITLMKMRQPGTGGKRSDYLRDRYRMRAVDWLLSIGQVGLFLVIVFVSRATPVFSSDASPLKQALVHALGIS